MRVVILTFLILFRIKVNQKSQPHGDHSLFFGGYPGKEGGGTSVDVWHRHESLTMYP